MREGDNFDPREWFNRVVLEKRKSEVIQQARSPANLASVVDPLSTEKLSPRPPQTPISFPLQETRQANRLGRRLAEISDVWDDVQESRRRDAVYKFLGVVFGIVTDYKGKRRRQLLRRAYRFAGLAFDEHQNPFAAPHSLHKRRTTGSQTNQQIHTGAHVCCSMQEIAEQCEAIYEKGRGHQLLRPSVRTSAAGHS